MEQKFIDLGLPSGNLWATENEVAENGQPLYATFDEAVKQYGENLPTREDWQELLDNVPHLWDKNRMGMLFVARNGAELFLPDMGYRTTDGFNMQYYSNYWSATSKDANNAYCSDGVGANFISKHNFGLSVRLIKKGGKQ